jgi:DNA polymerase-1
LDARIVLCLHDELLLQVPIATADDAAVLLLSCLDETATRWAAATPVRFVADVSVIERWSDAKG